MDPPSPMQAPLAATSPGADSWLIRAGNAPGDGWIARAARQLTIAGGCAVLLHAPCDDALPPASADESAASPNQPDPAGFLHRRRAARAIAGAALGVAAGDLAIMADGAGAPMFRGAAAGLSLSFSARGGWSVLAIARGAVGIDIEEVIADAAIPWNMLRPDERARLRTLPAGHAGPAFTRLWAAKEALAKALRTGFKLAPEDLMIASDHVAVRNCDGFSGTWRRIAASRLEMSLASGDTLFHVTRIDLA